MPTFRFPDCVYFPFLTWQQRTTPLGQQSQSNLEGQNLIYLELEEPILTI